MYREHRYYIWGVLLFCLLFMGALIISNGQIKSRLNRMEKENRQQRIEINRLIKKDPILDIWKTYPLATHAVESMCQAVQTPSHTDGCELENSSEKKTQDHKKAIGYGL